MEVSEVRNEPARKLVGLEFVGKPGGPEIPALWQAYMPRMPEVRRTRDTFGASHGRADVGPGVIAYLVGSEVADFEGIPSGMVGWEVEGGPYAIVECPSLARMGETMQWFHAEWLPTSGYEIGSELLEYYPPSFPDDPRFELRFALRRL